MSEQSSSVDLPICIEHVKMTGHIVDSLLLPKVLDAILARGGKYRIDKLDIGVGPGDTSEVTIEVRAPSAQTLDAILNEIHPHGAMPVEGKDCLTATADMDGAFPEGFYCSTNFRTQVRLAGEWVDVEDQEMDCGILVDNQGPSVRCIPMVEVKHGDRILIGRQGTRVFPPDSELRKQEMFEFMASPVSSERPKGVSVRQIARAIRKCKESGEKVLAVLGPAVVHTGGAEWVAQMIRDGWIDILFAGNALATHDIEQALYGTSLGVSLAEGVPTHEGHEHHLRTINRMRRLGSLESAVEQGVLTKGIMYECVARKIPYLLAGSIRDDGPLPGVITDVLEAQTAMRELIPGVGFCLMVATTLHSVAVGNLLPAWVKVACVDITPATVTKLMDRGSTQTVGIVSDAEPFFRSLVGELAQG